jgi:hypothetical protein
MTRKRRPRIRTKKKRNKVLKLQTKKPKIIDGFERMSCSPAVKDGSVSEHSCMTPDILEVIRKSYNDANPNNPITVINPLQIWYELRKRNSECKTEDCWLKNMKDKVLQRQIKQYVFAPSQPPEWKNNPREWLSNIDIEQVMKQYMIAYPLIRVSNLLDRHSSILERRKKRIINVYHNNYVIFHYLIAEREILIM